MGFTTNGLVNATLLSVTDGSLIEKSASQRMASKTDLVDNHLMDIPANFKPCVWSNPRENDEIWFSSKEIAVKSKISHSHSNVVDNALMNLTLLRVGGPFDTRCRRNYMTGGIGMLCFFFIAEIFKGKF